MSTDERANQIDMFDLFIIQYGLQLLRSELAREKMWSRIHLIPLLTAEEDRDLVRRHYADLAREKELMGTNTSVYNSDRYVALKNNGLLTLSLFNAHQLIPEDHCARHVLLES